MTDRFCIMLTMSQRLSLTPAVYVFLEKDGKYLFGRRQNTGYFDGSYQVPAGHVEPNETPKEAMVREAKEEVGVDIEVADLEFVNVVYRMNQEKTGYRVDFFFKTSKWKGEPQNIEPEKCDDLQWFSLEALPENVTPLMPKVVKAMGEKLYLVEALEG